MSIVVGGPKSEGGRRFIAFRLRLLLAFVLLTGAVVAVALLITSAPLDVELLVFGISIVLAAMTGALVTSWLARPVEHLAEAASRAAAGELSEAIRPSTRDEVGRAALAINDLNERLRRVSGDVDISRGEVRNSVRRLGEALRATQLRESDEPDLRKMMSVVLETALVALQGRSGAVYLLSARRTDLRLKVGRHLDPRARDERILVGQGLAGWVAQHRRGVCLPSADAPVPADPEPTETTALAVPLETQSQLIGVLAIYGRTTSVPFGEEDVETIMSLGRAAGVSVENMLLHQEAQRMSITDGLTAIWNRRYFEMRWPQEFERAFRFQRPLSIAVIDIDHFKKVNDVYGHQRGDAILIEIAQRLVGNIRREIDVLARYGGEEFVLVLPETGADGANVVAEKMRIEVAGLPFASEGETPVAVTISIGYAVYPENGTTPRQLLDAADQALYEAKARGRNRVVSAGGKTNSPNLAPGRTQP
ncbi:MAG: diguanylate cyclase [Actinomycetota bacterium]